MRGIRLLQVKPLLHRIPSVTVQSARPASRRPYLATRTTHARLYSSSTMDPKIDEINSFYLQRNTDDWFQSPPELDDEIRTRYHDYINKARSNEIDHWAETPKGALAMILLLDQFPRNIFRGSGESFSSDHKAHSIATTAIAKKFDRELGKTNKYEQYFFYLPLMHAENLCSQIACISMLENLASTCEDNTVEKEYFTRGIGFAQRHADCILQLGRFPKRNEPIGRETTDKEARYLEQHPAGF